MNKEQLACADRNSLIAEIERLQQLLKSIYDFAEERSFLSIYLQSICDVIGYELEEKE